MVKKDQYQWNGAFLDRVLIRSPYFSITEYHNGDLDAPLRNEVFRQALWLASPDFYSELEKPDFCLTRLDSRKQAALRRYFNRACFRATPFGGFSSFSLAGWSAESPLRSASV